MNTPEESDDIFAMDPQDQIKRPENLGKSEWIDPRSLLPFNEREYGEEHFDETYIEMNQ